MGIVKQKPTDLSHLTNVGLVDIHIEIPRGTPGDEYWVRPLGQEYGVGDGSDYDNAFTGFVEIPTLQAGDIIHIRGTHNEYLLLGSKFLAGVAANYITVDFGADSEIDPGYIDMNYGSPDYGIRSNGRQYIGIDYPRVTRCNQEGILCEGVTSDIIVRYGDFSYCSNQGTQLEDTSSNIKFYRCKSHHNTDDGFSQHDTTVGWYYYCEAYNNAEGFNTSNAATIMNIHGGRCYDNTTSDIDGGAASTINTWYVTYEKPPVGSVVNKTYGLVAAYNFQPSPGGVLVDISGEGNNGAITLAPSTNEGMNFKGDSGSKVYISPSPIITTEQFTIAGRIKWDGKIGTLVDQVIFSNNNSTGDAIIDSFGLRADHFQWNYDVAGTYKYSAAGVAIPIGEWIDFVLSVNGERVHTLFINGDGDTGIEGGNLYRSGGGSGIGDRHTSSVGSSQPFSGEIEDIRLFNYAFSEQEAIAYHNQFAKQISQRHNFDDLGVGSTI